MCHLHSLAVRGSFPCQKAYSVSKVERKVLLITGFFEQPLDIDASGLALPFFCVHSRFCGFSACNKICRSSLRVSVCWSLCVCLTVYFSCRMPLITLAFWLNLLCKGQCYLAIHLLAFFESLLNLVVSRGSCSNRLYIVRRFIFNLCSTQTQIYQVQKWQPYITIANDNTYSSTDVLLLLGQAYWGEITVEGHSLR